MYVGIENKKKMWASPMELLFLAMLNYYINKKKRISSQTNK